MTLRDFVNDHGSELDKFEKINHRLGKHPDSGLSPKEVTLDNAEVMVIEFPFFLIFIDKDNLLSETFTIKWTAGGIPADYFNQTFSFDQIPEFIQTVNMLWG